MSGKTSTAKRIETGRKKVKKKAAAAGKTGGSLKKKITGKSATAITKPAAKKPVNGAVTAPPSKIKPAKPQPAAPVAKDKAVKPPRKSSRKPGISLPPPPPIEVSDHPKTRVKHLLVSQPKPADPERNPFCELGKRHNVAITFRHFIKVEGMSAQEFRAQRIDILEHGAVILTSKLAVDHYFRICNEMRITVPETMKYFCINEQTAYYLQKYIQYRKRKIFFGHGTIIDLVDVIRKNRAEKFLLPVSDVHKEQIADFLEEVKISFTKAVFYKTVCADLSDMKSLAEFDVIVFFTPVGVKSLKQNFPGFKQGNTRIAAFGHTTAQTVKQLGYRLDIFAPNPQNPSMTGALEAYIKEANKR
jgi:uroporphyrinogen-III synthase